MIGAALLLGLALPPPPSSLKLDPFYKKYVAAGPMAIVSSDAVQDEALYVARDIVLGMLHERPDILKSLADQGIRVAIIGKDERTTQMPEYRRLNIDYPETDWDVRARGLGPTVALPLASVGEENLLGLPGDKYVGESILVHEFSHAVLEVAIRKMEPDLEKKVGEAYAAALKSGRWRKTYAAATANEYWAEGVQSWFSANRWSDKPNGVHGPIKSKALLQGYDPALASLIQQVFRKTPWKWKDPAK